MFRTASSDADSASRPSYEEMYDTLKEVYQADGTAMLFSETAREHRKYGVFDEEFFDWLTMKENVEGPNTEAGSMYAKVRARLANPLLRQPAPFEF